METHTPSLNFSVVETSEKENYEMITLLINLKDLELFALFKLKTDFIPLDLSRSPYHLHYYNIETEFRFKYDMKYLCPNSRFEIKLVVHATSACFNHSKRMIVIGAVESFSTKTTSSYEGLIPVLYAFENSGHNVTLLDRLEIGGMEPIQGVFTIHEHPNEDIFFSTFAKHVLISIVSKGKFEKFRIIDKFSETVVYQSVLAGDRFCGFCAKTQNFNILSFEGASLNVDSYN